MVSKRKGETDEVFRKRRYEYDKKRRPELNNLTKRWRKRNKDDPEYKRKNLERTKNYNKRMKLLCLEHYGDKCRCCGEPIIEFLTVEHVNGGGRKHREENKITDMNRWLVLNNYPEGFEILCYNCNCGKRLNNICPHELYNAST